MLSKRKFSRFTTIMVIIGCLLLGFGLSWQRFLMTPIIPRNTQLDYVFPTGASVRVLAKELHALHLLSQPRYFIALAYLTGNAKHLHAGEYRFSGGIRPLALLQQMVRGQVVKRQITFIEGMTFKQIRQLLDNNHLLVHQLMGLPDSIVAVKLGLSGNPEGLFFPSTYDYTAGMSDRQILLLAHHELQRQLAHVWQMRDYSVPYTQPYQALIVASIIEKEAAIAADRPMIAAVIINRLAKQMRLQMDSTVIYALGSAYRPPLTHQDLQVNSPYNTYLYGGLPPTPIASPGLASLIATLHPAHDNYLFFVAKGDRSHEFSVTYQAQQQAIAKYLR